MPPRGFRGYHGTKPKIKVKPKAKPQKALLQGTGPKHVKVAHPKTPKPHRSLYKHPHSEASLSPQIAALRQLGKSVRVERPGPAGPQGPSGVARGKNRNKHSEFATVRRAPTASLETLTPKEAVTLGITAVIPESRAFKVAKFGKGIFRKALAKGATKAAPKTAARAGRVATKIPKVPRKVKIPATAGAIAAEPHSRTFVRRHYEATKEDPGKVLGTTARAAPGIVTGPASIAVSAGISAKRAALGQKHAGDPIKATGKSIIDFGKETAKIATSDSDAEAKKIIKEKTGLTGLVMVAPAIGKVTAKPRGLKPVRQHEAKTPIGRYGARRRGRTDVSRYKAEEQTQSVMEIHRKGKATVTEATKAPKKRGGVKVKPEDLLPTFMEEGLTGPNKVVIARIRKKYDREYKDAPELRQHANNLLDYLSDPKAWESKHLANAVEASRAIGQSQRYSERARLSEFQKTHGLRHTDEIAEQILEQQTGRGRNKTTGKVVVSKNVRRRAERKAVKIARKEVEAVRKEHGLAEPEKFGHIPAVPIRPSNGTRQRFRQFGKRGYPIRLGEGSLAAGGNVARTGKALLQGTIAAQALRPASVRFTLRSLVRGDVGGRSFTAKQAVDELHGKDAKHNPRDVVFVPDSYVSAIRQTDPALLQAGLKEARDQITSDFAKLSNMKGVKGRLVEKSVVDEMEAQTAGLTPGKEVLSKVSRTGSRAILWNPAWALGQVPATLAGTGFIGPRAWTRGMRVTKKLHKTDPQTSERVGAIAGRAPGGAGFESSALRATPQAATRLAEFTHEVHRSRIGRAGLKVLDGPAYFNKWSEGYIRQAGVTEAMLKQVRGPLANLRFLRKDFRELWDATRGESEVEQIKLLAQNRALMDRIAADTGPVIGEFGRLTRSGVLPESAIAPLAIFYPFMRMSIKFLTYGLPAKHPIKSAVSYYLAQWNADELKKFLGGDPAFFAEWATILARTGEGEKAITPVPFSRVAPGGSFIPETIGELTGGSRLSVAIRGLNPAFGGIYAAVSGQDPLSGRQLDQKAIDDIKLGVSVAAGSPAPLRAVAAWQNLDRKNLISKKQNTALTQLFNKLRPEKEKLIRGYVVPIWPQNSEKARDIALAGRALEKSTKYGISKEGWAMLDPLFAKYGLAEARAKEKVSVGRKPGAGTNWKGSGGDSWKPGASGDW